MKNFVKPKYSRMFAVLFAKRQFYTFIVGAFFYAFTASVLANNIGYQTPLENCSTVKYGNCCLATTEGDSLSYIHLVTKNFRLKMPNNAKITNSVNNSNGIGTFASRNEANLLNFIESLNCRWVGLKYKRTHYELRLIISKHSRHFVKGENLDELLANLKARLLGFGIISLTENKA